jgi:osmotically-inducible protein OsmY
MKTDKQLRTDVQAELDWEPSVDAGAIGVAVEDGVVTLNGRVRSFSEKWAAENAAERVAGVKAVSDELEVQLPRDYTRTDTDIARAAVEALRRNVNVPEDRIQVEVDHGLITLKGEVNYQFQKQAAEDAVAPLIGVTGVANDIIVKPNISAGAIKEQIEKAFKRSAQLDANRISVEATGNKVILHGEVDTRLEGDEAEDVAWRAPGVYDVENDIQVVS